MVKGMPADQVVLVYRSPYVSRRVGAVKYEHDGNTHIFINADVFDAIELGNLAKGKT